MPAHYAVCAFHGVIFMDDSGSAVIEAKNMVPVHEGLYGKPIEYEEARCPYPTDEGRCGKFLKFV